MKKNQTPSEHLIQLIIKFSSLHYPTLTFILQHWHQCLHIYVKDPAYYSKVVYSVQEQYGCGTMLGPLLLIYTV